VASRRPLYQAERWSPVPCHQGMVADQQVRVRPVSVAQTAMSGADGSYAPLKFSYDRNGLWPMDQASQAPNCRHAIQNRRQFEGS